MGENNLQPVVPRDVLVKQGMSAIGYLASGLLLVLVTAGSKMGILGIVLSGAVLIFGIGALVSRDREDKKPGLILTAAGVMGLIMRFGIPVLKPFAATILGIGAVAMFAMGIWKGIKFLIGLKSRR